jgi:RNA polymerase sigma factor (sigma-70 family)
MTMDTTMDDWQLLQAYEKNRSEAAFTELVRRHLEWVHAVALRHVSEPHLAEDVVQSVFVLLARKAHDLGPGTLLGGWLFRTTRFVAAHALRAEQRRKTREAAAFLMSHDTASAGADVLWQQLAPHLDQAVAALSEADRAAILLRFYERMPMRKIGLKLGVSEEAAKKRISRSLERMRTFLGRRGVKLDATTVAAVMAEKTVHTAPVGLGCGVVKLSLAASATSGAGVVPELARETLRAWEWAKIKLAAGLTAASLALIFVGVQIAAFHTPNASESVRGNQAQVPAISSNNIAEARSLPTVNGRSGASGKLGVFAGVVVDEQGNPIPGAKVWAGFGQNPFAEDTTDESGQFALDKIAAPAFVTVTADGFAADQQGFDPTNLPNQMLFRLSPSLPFQVRVLDESGQGVPGVRLFLQRWWGRTGTLGQYLPQQTDADGRLQWLSAPKGELLMEFIKSGYRYSRTNKFYADGQEHAIVLHPAVTVTGSVADAETGTPVASFRFTSGHSQPWSPADPTPMWDLRSRPGTNGFYELVIEEEQVPYLRIEADGYETVETEIQLTNGVESICDFRLKPQSAANSIRGVVLLPDGTPAAGVEVALCTAQVGVMLSGTAFEPGPFGNISHSQSAGYRKKTDEQGAFSFEPKPGAHTLVAVCSAGLGQVRCFDFSKPLEIRLQPWGRIEGSVRTRDGQWTGRKVEWQHAGNLTSWKTLFYDSKGFAARSDKSGKFTLEHVPPGDGFVATDDGPEAAPILSPWLHVSSGETAQAQIGGVGQMVTGKLEAPRGVEIRNWSNQVTLARLLVEWDSYSMPKDLTGNAAERWKLEFEDSERGRTWFRNQHSYDFKVGADGSFTIPEVLPGHYRLFVNVAQGYLGSGPDWTPRHPGDPQIAFSGTKFAVTDASAESGARLELGTIILTATH